MGSALASARRLADPADPMSMGAGRSFELPREGRPGDRPLGPGFEITELEVVAAELVADDNGEVGAVACSCLELLPKLPVSELCPHGESRAAQLRGNPQPGGGVGRVGADDD